jgi:Putative restriction endonuclease
VDNCPVPSVSRATLDAVTAPPLPLRPLTAAEYAALPEDSDHDYSEAYLRVDAEGGFLRAGECVLAVEIPSPGSYRTDQAIKHGEYAEAGIGPYWMIDLVDGPALTACHLGGPFGYVDEPPVTGTFTTQHPFPVRVDLGALT